jgi:glycosyltransferase involved in cell wall biosynthesis
VICASYAEGYDPTVQINRIYWRIPKRFPIAEYANGVPWLLTIRKLLKKIDPDVLDSHYIAGQGYLAALSGFHPLVLTAWGSDILIAPKQSRFHRFVIQRVLKRADKIICDSEVVRTNLLDLKADPVKIAKIFNGIDSNLFAPEKKDAHLKRKLQIDEEAQLVICTRNFESIYNHDMLFKSIPLILAEEPNTVFVMVGAGSLREYLESLAQELDIRESVRFVGYVPHSDLPNYLASSDVYVSTSLSDSTSLSLQEAMACEVPPVVTDVLANREWVTDEETGFIIPFNDMVKLAERIVYLLRNKQLRMSFGAKGRQIIVDNADYITEMGKVEELYSDLIRTYKSRST